MKLKPLWLSEISASPPRGKPLQADLTVDVAIIGGGFVGLWSAIWIKILNPDTRVAVFEKGRAGHGASGMNGGFVMTWWPKIGRLAQIMGDDDARWLADMTSQNVLEMEEFLRDEQIDAEFERKGWLWTATCPVHIGSWQSVMNKASAVGRPDIYRTVESDELARRAGSPRHLAGVCEPVNGKVHSGKLGDGLAVIATRKGVELYEDADVQNLTYGRQVRLSVGNHMVTADKVIIASNIAAEHYRELSRSMVLVTSAIVATDPIADRLAEIGWTGGETITDSQTRLNYYRTTRSGRLVFGMAVGRLFYGNRIGSDVFADTNGIAATEKDFRRVYPALSDVPITFGWSGPIDRTYDGLPLIGRFPNAPNVIYGVGWSGNGVGPSRVGARMLAGLALDRQERWTGNGFIGRAARKFPPEPIRYVGGSIVRAAVIRKDEAEIAGRPVAALDRMLARLAPASAEDKE